MWNDYGFSSQLQLLNAQICQLKSVISNQQSQIAEQQSQIASLYELISSIDPSPSGNLLVKGDLVVSGNVTIKGDTQNIGNLNVGVNPMSSSLEQQENTGIGEMMGSGNLILNRLVLASSGAVLINPGELTCAFSTVNATKSVPIEDGAVNVLTVTNNAEIQNSTTVANLVTATTSTDNYSSALLVTNESGFSQSLQVGTDYAVLTKTKLADLTQEEDIWVYVGQPLPENSSLLNTKLLFGLSVSTGSTVGVSSTNAFTFYGTSVTSQTSYPNFSFNFGSGTTYYTDGSSASGSSASWTINCNYSNYFTSYALITINSGFSTLYITNSTTGTNSATLSTKYYSSNNSSTTLTSLSNKSFMIPQIFWIYNAQSSNITLTYTSNSGNLSNKTCTAGKYSSIFSYNNSTPGFITDLGTPYKLCFIDQSTYSGNVVGTYQTANDALSSQPIVYFPYNTNLSNTLRTYNRYYNGYVMAYTNSVASSTLTFNVYLNARTNYTSTTGFPRYYIFNTSTASRAYIKPTFYITYSDGTTNGTDGYTPTRLNPQSTSGSTTTTTTTTSYYLVTFTSGTAAEITSYTTTSVSSYLQNVLV